MGGGGCGGCRGFISFWPGLGGRPGGGGGSAKIKNDNNAAF